jgi:histidyl-tRNA synthetase
MSLQKPRGTQDFLPQDVERWQYIEKKARDLCRRFQYHEIRTPIFEHTELFQRGVGETTDIVEKEMYTFADRSERSLTLRPEGTAGVVRAYVENKLFAVPDVQKLYYMGPMFRYERMMAGRYRQFHQFGVEAIGSADPSIDAEVIALGYQFYEELGLQHVRVELNSVGTPQCRQRYRAALQDFFRPHLDTLCKDCQSRFERNPLRILDCKIDGQVCVGAPSILDYLSDEAAAHFAAVRTALDGMGIPYTVNPGLVRGLDYYTHTAFEYMADGIGTITTIGGGGRYNGLVGQLGGQDQPGVGLGLGLERLLLVMDAQRVGIPPQNPPDIYVIALGEQAEQRAGTLLYELRKAGISADKDYLQRKMKGQFKAADRLQAGYVAILGEDELARGEIVVKTMATGHQETYALEQFVQKMYVILRSKSL